MYNKHLTTIVYWLAYLKDREACKPTYVYYNIYSIFMELTLTLVITFIISIRILISGNHDREEACISDTKSCRLT